MDHACSARTLVERWICKPYSGRLLPLGSAARGFLCVRHPGHSPKLANIFAAPQGDTAIYSTEKKSGRWMERERRCEREFEGRNGERERESERAREIENERARDKDSERAKERGML